MGGPLERTQDFPAPAGSARRCEQWRATTLGRTTERLEVDLVFGLAGPMAGKRVPVPRHVRCLAFPRLRGGDMEDRCLRRPSHEFFKEPDGLLDHKE